MAAAFLKRFARMLPTDWRILQWSKETDETIISSLGSVRAGRLPRSDLREGRPEPGTRDGTASLGEICER